MKIIGIDPGYGRVGIAIVEKKTLHEKETLIYSECLVTPNENIYDRLTMVGTRIKELLEKHSPNILATETLFLTKNQKTAMHVAEARGIIAYEANLHHIPIFEYSPPQIKSAITGDGKSDKTQIIKMIPLLVTIPPEKSTKKMLDDEYDAIAVALTCLANEAKNSLK